MRSMNRARGSVASGFVTGAVYHENGLVESANYLNGQQLTQTLDGRQLPDQLKTAKAGGATAVWLTHSYDARRKLSSILDSDGAGDNEGRSFTYDANGRLLTAAGPWGTGSYVVSVRGTRLEGG